jgi:endonuclease/exonuclease/phosphatase family metal-dependent hydrolase
MPGESAISIVCINTFGVPFYVSGARLGRLAAKLSRSDYTVICLQEIQQNTYLPVLRRTLVNHPHLVFFLNFLAPKGGLVTATAAEFPPVDTAFHPYPNQGRPFSIGFSDWALNKGVLLTRLRVRDRNCVVMNTHLQANYRGKWQLSNQQSRIQMDQVKFLVDLVKAQPPDSWIVVCGDFNFPRQSPVYEWMMEHGGLLDPLAADPRPTYQPLPLVRSDWKTTLDYILCRLPPDVPPRLSADVLPMVNEEARWGFQRFLTDHLALVLHVG